jgi:hypothetical protein
VPNLAVIIPTSLAAILKDAVFTRASSLDSVVTAVLSQYLQSGRNRAYQISTSAALLRDLKIENTLYGFPHVGPRINPSPYMRTQFCQEDITNLSYLEISPNRMLHSYKLLT